MLDYLNHLVKIDHSASVSDLGPLKGQSHKNRVSFFLHISDGLDLKYVWLGFGF